MLSFIATHVTFGLLLGLASPVLAPPKVALGAASPEDASAKKAFTDADRAFRAGDFRGAAEGFERAYKLKPHHAALWNAARSWESAGDPVRAANLLEKYLQEAPTGARDRDKAVASLKSLNERLARVEVRGVGVSSLHVDGLAAEEGARLYVTAGEHVITGDAEGTQIKKAVQVEPGQLLSVTLERPAPVVAPQAPKPSKQLPPVVFIVSAGATVVAGGFLIASGLNTVGQKQAFLDDRGNQAKLDDAYSAQYRTNVILGTTVALAVITGVLATLTQWKAPHTETALHAPNQGQVLKRR
jgi:hypothetical protein